MHVGNGGLDAGCAKGKHGRHGVCADEDERREEGGYKKLGARTVPNSHRLVTPRDVSEKWRGRRDCQPKNGAYLLTLPRMRPRIYVSQLVMRWSQLWSQLGEKGHLVEARTGQQMEVGALTIEAIRALMALVTCKQVRLK